MNKMVVLLTKRSVILEADLGVANVSPMSNKGSVANVEIINKFV